MLTHSPDRRATTMSTRAVLALLIVLCSRISIAQTADSSASSPSYYRFNVSEGVNTLGIMDGEAGIGMRVSFAVEHGETVWTGALSAQLSDFALFDVPHAVLVELGGLYGRAHTEKWFHWSYSGGAALMYAERRGNPIASSGWFSPNYESIPSWGVAALGEAQAIVTPLPFLGIGATVIASVNTFRPYLAAMITLQVGKL